MQVTYRTTPIPFSLSFSLALPLRPDSLYINMYKKYIMYNKFSRDPKRKRKQGEQNKQKKTKRERKFCLFFVFFSPSISLSCLISLKNTRRTSNGRKRREKREKEERGNSPPPLPPVCFIAVLSSKWIRRVQKDGKRRGFDLSFFTGLYICIIKNIPFIHSFLVSGREKDDYNRKNTTRDFRTWVSLLVLLLWWGKFMMNTVLALTVL